MWINGSEYLGIGLLGDSENKPVSRRVLPEFVTDVDTVEFVVDIRIGIFGFFSRCTNKVGELAKQRSCLPA